MDLRNVRTTITTIIELSTLLKAFEVFQIGQVHLLEGHLSLINSLQILLPLEVHSSK